MAANKATILKKTKAHNLNEAYEKDQTRHHITNGWRGRSQSSRLSAETLALEVRHRFEQVKTLKEIRTRND